MSSLAYIGLALAMGNYIYIPIMTRNLAVQYHNRPPTGNNFLLDSKTIECLVSGALDTPDSLVSDFAYDWWSEKKSRSTKNALDYTVANSGLRYHNEVLKRSETDATEHDSPAASSNPSVTPTVQPGPSKQDSQAAPSDPSVTSTDRPGPSNQDIQMATSDPSAPSTDRPGPSNQDIQMATSDPSATSTDQPGPSKQDSQMAPSDPSATLAGFTHEEAEFYKPFYGWYRGTFDDRDGNHCIHCRLYRAITMGVWDKLKDMKNMADALDSFHRTERNMSERRAVGLNFLYEEAVIKEAESAAADSSTTAAAESPVQVAGTIPDASSKWTWGVDLDENDIRRMVRAADTGFVLPHSGYDESLGDSSLASDTDNPTPTIIQEVEDETTNRLPYEPLSTDIRHDRELELHEIPHAFSNFPLNPGSGVKSDFERIPSVKPKMWLPFPPNDYVPPPRLPPLQATPALTPADVNADSDIEVCDPIPTFITLDDDPDVTVPPTFIDIDEDITIQGPTVINPPAITTNDDIVIEGPYPTKPRTIIDVDDDDDVTEIPTFINLDDDHNDDAAAFVFDDDGYGPPDYINLYDESDEIEIEGNEMEGILGTMPAQVATSGENIRTDIYTSMDFQEFDDSWLGE